jgi:indolepyruvate ferredoxin oxidoreductase beta subunit
MNRRDKQQIIISGVGGQGVLFLTRLLAETAIYKGLPVMTAETHGMAQRGGTVVSHLKIGGFFSPMIRPGRADLLLLLKSENLAAHAGFLHPAGRAAVNGTIDADARETLPGAVFSVDADAAAATAKNPRAANLSLLGAFLAGDAQTKASHPLFCGLEDIRAVLGKRFADRPALLKTALAALTAGTTAPVTRRYSPSDH